MKIIIAFQLNGVLEPHVVSDNVLYRPDLEKKSPHIVQYSLCGCRPDVLIVREHPERCVLEGWRRAVPISKPLFLIWLVAAGQVPPTPAAVDGITVHRLDAGMPHAEIAALTLAESINANLLRTRTWPAVPTSRRTPGTTVAMIGAGIVNLITAWALVGAGYRPVVYDAAPHPRSDTHWQNFGCTFGGCDARVFSINEGRHHHVKSLETTPQTNTQFSRPVAAGGWLAATLDGLADQDARWIEEFSSVPPWLAMQFDRDITSFNRDSMPLWRQLRDTAPELFADSGFVDGLLRLYPSPEKYRGALYTERAIGSILRDLEPGALADEHPALAEAVAGGAVAGALQVLGFSLNVHKFGCALVALLERHGVAFHWETRIDAVERDVAGLIRGLATPSGPIAADHYVISAGAFANDLVRAFGSSAMVAPVIGMWLTLSDEPPYLDLPLKISRSGFASDGAAEGANVIPGTDAEGRRVIHLSSGHGYIGIGNHRPDPATLLDLSKAVEETAAQYFPSRYARALERNAVPRAKRYCVRPWTPSGLGVFDAVAAARGGLGIVTGGHNTGGFAQAPSVAAAVVAALDGQPHPMHTLYHPDRFRDFMRAQVASASHTFAEAGAA